MKYRVEIIKNGGTAVSKDREADNPQQAVNWVINKTKVRPFYAILAMNTNGDMWAYQVLPKIRSKGVKVTKTAYERNVTQGCELNSILAGNTSLRRFIRWN